MLMDPDEQGYFRLHVPTVKAGDTYWYVVGEKSLPDPCSRFLPRGVDGPSEIVDPSSYLWKCTSWKRPLLRGRVIYELHVGTFTPEGTYAAAAGKLEELRTLGVNAVELMPLGEFSGRWNWGYDGVFPYSPSHRYGTPDELRAFIDAAHEHGIAVIVDVVYNHLGPSGNVLPLFSSRYLRQNSDTGWGAGLNFDGEGSEPVRQFFLQNAVMWLDDYRVDGLRLDATHAIHDASSIHLVSQIAGIARTRGAFTIAEDDRNDAKIVSPPEDGGWGVNGVWADDFHHVVRVGLTGERIGYLANYSGDISEWLAALHEGWLFRGQHFPSWRRPRGTPAAHLPQHKFVFCISNHDQVGNRPCGDRLHDAVSPAMYRAASMLLCLAPYTPMLFQGQEWAASSPFPFFTDFAGDIGENMAKNRRAEFERVGMAYPQEELDQMPDPQAPGTFQAAKLDWRERSRPQHAAVLKLYQECLRLRAEQSVFAACDRSLWRVESHAAKSFSIVWDRPGERWTLIVSLAPGFPPTPPHEGVWQMVLSSNEARFGGDVNADAEARLYRAIEGPAG